MKAPAAWPRTVNPDPASRVGFVVVVTIMNPATELPDWRVPSVAVSDVPGAIFAVAPCGNGFDKPAPVYSQSSRAGLSRLADIVAVSTPVTPPVPGAP